MAHRQTRRATRLLPLVLLPLVAAGCGGSGGGDAAAASPPTSSTTSASSAPAAPATSTAPAPTSDTGTGGTCEPTGESVPADAVTAPVDTTTLPNGGDLTGDPAHGPTTVWIESNGSQRLLGVVTGDGVVSSVPIESAGPVGTTALAANLDGAGPVEVLLDDNRTTSLYAVVDCRLQPVLGPDGQQWQFDRGFRDNGTGVGCTVSAADGTRTLLGLDLDSETDPPQVTSTEIPLDGLTASIGASTTTTLPAVGGQPDPQEDVARSVSCDALSLTNGLAEPQG